MPGRRDFKKMAEIKLREGKTLIENGCFDGARYLLGYVIEFSLKARICKILSVEDYPKMQSFKTHNFRELLTLSGLEKKLNTAKSLDPGYMTAWSIIESWKEDFRYNPIGSTDKVGVLELLIAIEDKQNGIFKWIKKYW
jgi:hypothetical protein